MIVVEGSSHSEVWEGKWNIGGAKWTIGVGTLCT